MESGFMMALDYMIQLADRDQDHKVFGLLCRTSKKESRQELLRRVAVGGGAFETRLVLIREEERNMMGGGILDERNDCGFSTLPESETWKDGAANDPERNARSADDLSNGEDSSTQGGRRHSGLNGRVMGSMYSGNASGINI
ncbi:hypothetical protein Rs2_14759 [Raphanus sativus]|nr:hypothetical protein Rs2_14759 [Raphanus sativus]